MMTFRTVAILAVMGMAGCQSYTIGPHLQPSLPPQQAQLPQPDGAAETPATTTGQGYHINDAEAAQIPGRILQQVNLLRANIGLSQLELSPQLSAAALAHSRDMSAQNRAWHWGSDGSSPLDRVRKQGYQGKLLGENISETYETDIQTLSAWMTTRETRDVIMDPAARELGFAWYQEPTGKLWWTLITGG